MSGYSYIESNISTIAQKIHAVCSKLNRNPEDITLIAVSKTFPSDAVQSAFSAGHRHFGENKVQELYSKHLALNITGDINYQQIKWHLIGHLQSNKVKLIVPFIHLIHSLDSARLAAKIQTEAEKLGRTINCLVQVNTSDEDQKSGVAPAGVLNLVREVSAMKNIHICGLMTIAKFIDDYNNESQREIVRDNFKELKGIYDELGSLNMPGVEMQYLSMGMTSDFDIALEEGSNMLRIGTAIFGARNKSEIN